MWILILIVTGFASLITETFVLVSAYQNKEDIEFSKILYKIALGFGGLRSISFLGAIALVIYKIIRMFI